MIAFLAAPMFIAEAAGEYVADEFDHLEFDHLIVLVILGSACLITLCISKGYVIPVLFTLYFFLLGLASIILTSNLQQKISTRLRATATSVVGFGDRLGAVIWFLVNGIIAETFFISTAVSVFTVLIIFACMIGLWFDRSRVQAPFQNLTPGKATPSFRYNNYHPALRRHF